MSETAQPSAAWRPAKVTTVQIWFATVVALCAWTFGVYDFVLFGTLLPEIGKTAGWSLATQAEIATWVALGTVLVALCIGPLVDRFGRRAGVMITVGGAAICSALTAALGSIGILPLILIRSCSGLGYGEQGVNGAYLSELYVNAEDPLLVSWRGRLYSIVQGGWPLGALLAALLTAQLLPAVGWKGCFVVAAIPSFVIAILARFLRESPQFEVVCRWRDLRRQGRQEQADDLARANGIDPSAAHGGGLLVAFRGEARRPSLVLGLAHLLNWFTVQVFAVLGTTVLVNVHHVSFQNSLLVLVLSNIWGYVGYLVHGALGDKFGRRNVIAFGWCMCGFAFAALLIVPSSFWMVVALYSAGQFFLVGPYACMLFFVGESYKDARVRGTGASLVVGIGPVGAILAGLAATALLKAGFGWQQAALYFGAIPSVLSGLCVLFARPVALPGREEGQEAGLPVPAALP